MKVDILSTARGFTAPNCEHDFHRSARPGPLARIEDEQQASNEVLAATGTAVGAAYLSCRCPDVPGQATSESGEPVYSQLLGGTASQRGAGPVHRGRLH